MENEIIFYTIHCPNCNTLKRMLDAKNIQYTTNTNVEEMRALGMQSAPALKVNGQLMNFREARNWLKGIE